MRRLGIIHDALMVGPYEKRVTVRGRPWRFQNRGPAAVMGRFGGGWDFQVGFQTGRRGLHGTIIINLGRSSLRIDPAPTRKARP